VSDWPERLTARGYEIHHGQTQLRADMQMASVRPAQELLPGMLWQGGNSAVIGTYLHGLFENAEVIHALFGHDAPSLEQVFERLAQGVGQWFEPGAL
jgi:adenosylcobyric acid synthase